MIKIYSGGRMPGLDTDWRNELPRLDNIRWLHPPYGGDANSWFPKDVILIRQSDMLYAHFVDGYEHKGVLTEIGIAYALGIPVVICASKQMQETYNFAMMCATSVVETFDEALDIIEFIAKRSLA